MKGYLRASVQWIGHIILFLVMSSVGWPTASEWLYGAKQWRKSANFSKNGGGYYALRRGLWQPYIVFVL